MKNFFDKLKLNLFVYKLIGIVLIAGFLLYVNTTYFDLPKYGNIPFYMVVLSVCSLHMILPYRLDKLVSSASLFLYTVYVLVQVCYCRMFDQYLYVGTAFSLFNEAKAYTSDAVALIGSTEKTVIAAGIIVLLMLNFIRRRKSKFHGKLVLMNLIIALIGFCGAYLLHFEEIKVIESTNVDLFEYHESDRYIYDRVTPKKTFVEYFGLEQFLYRDIKDNWLVDSSMIEEENESISLFLSENLPYQENEYTGMLEGKHLLLVEGESLTMAAVDAVLTPTLYKLIHEGWYFDNFYSPLLTGSTSDVETMMNTSLIPVNDGTIVSQVYAENTYPTTLAKGFKSAGYITNAVHNNYKLYYNRENYFASLGYDSFLDSFELGVENQSSDFICGQVLNWIPVFNEKDFTFWITYSGHQPYSVSSLSDEAQYPLIVQEEYRQYMNLVKQTYPDLDEEVQFYLAKNISLDKALESYIHTYSMMDKMDKLVIVLYGDHYVKGFSSETHDESEKILGRGMFDTPLTLWYPGIETKIIDKYCTDIDLMPTLFNLYGIEYDKSTILGNDIFDERYHGFQFTTTWIVYTENFTYSVEMGKFTELNVSEEQAREELSRYLDYQEISNLIFKNDYFAKETSNEKVTSY